MKKREFNPGLRIAPFDCVILLAGIVGAISAGQKIWWAGFIIAWVVLHFFCFCNVFRVSRTPEIIWSVAFIMIAIPTLTIGIPGWPITMGLSLIFSIALIWEETRQPRYHGIFWKQWNPKLPQWWENHLKD